MPGKSHYFIGNDPAKWRTNIPTFARVKYEGVYPGMDIVYYGNQGQLEYDFVVAPGADPGLVTLAFEGAEKSTSTRAASWCWGSRVAKSGSTNPWSTRKSRASDRGGRPLCDEGRAGGLSGGRLRSEPATGHRSRAGLFDLPGRQRR